VVARRSKTFKEVAPFSYSVESKYRASTLKSPYLDYLTLSSFLNLGNIKPFTNYFNLETHFLYL